VLLAAGLVLAGLNLRVPVASVPPVIDEIADDLGFSTAVAGLVTSTPILCFGLLAPVAPVLARRLGAERTLALALVPVLVGVLVRGGPSTGALFAGTILAGAGVAVGNVVVPAIVKERFERETGVVMGVYVATLGAGAALAAGLTVPLERALDRGWQAALAAWALPAALATGVVGLAVLTERGRSIPRGGTGGLRSLLRDRLAWQVTAFMGLQSLIFYAGLSWLPSILRDDGFGAGEAGALLALYVLAGIPTSLAVPVLATRVRDQRLLAAGVTLLETAGIAGLLFAPAAAWLWVSLLALGQGATFSLALTLFVLRAPDSRRAGELSGMAQAVGYSVAAAGTFAFGAVEDLSGGWELPLVLLLALTFALLVVGLGAGRARFVAAGDTPAP
jgi:CP family cyanate transporter-like MFS transporter